MQKGKILSVCRIILFAAVTVFISSCSAMMPFGNVGCAKSSDGELISYNVFGKGDVTLVFVHGWSCDSRYWRCQIPYFAKNYQVVTIDIAGHGHSGQNRKIYSLEGFGQDVKAVVEKIDAKKVILIGHSMGDGVIGQAAILMPECVIGLIGVDTLQNVEDSMPKEEFTKIVNGFKNDFKREVKIFVEPMLPKDVNPELKKWIIDDMSSAPPNVAISTFEQYVIKYDNRGMANLYSKIKVPVRCVNADLWPTNIEVNRKYIASYDVVFMKGAGHFVMLERPRESNKKLSDSIKEIIKINKEQN
jgi:pimeloyl-ACP methyl ester carboxylesterase